MNEPDALHYEERRAAREQGIHELVGAACLVGLFFAILVAIALTPGPRGALAGREGLGAQVFTCLILLAFLAFFSPILRSAFRRYEIQRGSNGEWHVAITDTDFIYSVPDERLDSPVTIPLRQIVRITKITTIDVNDSDHVEWCFFDAAGRRYQPCGTRSAFAPKPVFEALRRATPWAQFAEETVRDSGAPQRCFRPGLVLCVLGVAFLVFMISILIDAFSFP